MQHKQIRQSDNNPGQQNEASSTQRDNSFQKNVPPNTTQSNHHWQGDLAESDRALDPCIETAQSPPAIPDVANRKNTAEHIDSSLNNLEAIKDALPDA